MDLQILSVIKDLGLGGISIYLLYSLIKNRKNGNCISYNDVIKKLDDIYCEIKKMKEYEIEKQTKLEQYISLLVDKLINGK